MPTDEKSGPLDGSVSGTIGGGGPETGGPTKRPIPPNTPKAKPDKRPERPARTDYLAPTGEPDDLKPGPTDVNRR